MTRMLREKLTRVEIAIAIAISIGVVAGIVGIVVFYAEFSAAEETLSFPYQPGWIVVSAVVIVIAASVFLLAAVLRHVQLKRQGT